MSRDIQTKQEFDELVASGQLVLVDFYATWCGPCKMLLPVIDELAAEQAGAMHVVKVDVDALGEVAQQFGVRSVPSMLWFKDGVLLHRQIGLISKRQILDLSESFNGATGS